MAWNQDLRAALCDWLAGIGALTDAIGDRIFYGRPVEAPDRPFVTLAASKRAASAYPAAAWLVDVRLAAYAADPDDLDRVEAAVAGALAGTDPTGALTTDTVRCHDVRMHRIERDEALSGFEAQRYALLSRRMDLELLVTVQED